MAILADTGISHGLIGPRETPRLWDRHVLNCAVVQEAIPRREGTQQVIDVGSGWLTFWSAIWRHACPGPT